jgi:hypothetical protein
VKKNFTKKRPQKLDESDFVLLHSKVRVLEDRRCQPSSEHVATTPCSQSADVDKVTNIEI